MTPYALFLAALTVAVLSSMLVKERGMFALFEHIRSLAGVTTDDDGIRDGDNELARMLLCELCTGVVLALALVLVLWLFDMLTLQLALVYWLPVASLARIIRRFS